MTDAIPTSLVACIIFSTCLGQTSGQMVLFVVHVVPVRTRWITLTSKTIHIHLLQFGFMPGYNCWTKHEERWVIIEDNEEEEEHIDNYPTFSEHTDITMGGDEAEEEPTID